MQSHDFLSRCLVQYDDLKQCVDKMLEDDSVSKEMRVYEMRPTPFIRDSLKNLLYLRKERPSRCDWLLYAEGSYEELLAYYKYLSLKPVWKFANLDAMYPVRGGSLLYGGLKLKSRTKGGQPMVKVFSDAVDSIRRRTDRCVTLVEMSTEIKEEDFLEVSQWEDLESSILIHVSESEHFSKEDFTYNSFDLANNLPYRPVLAKLNTKLYLERLQIRAYYIVESLTMSIVGDILQNLFQPKTDRESVPLSYVYPVKGKNLLDITVKTHYCSGYVIIGDLSAFTATSQNSWVHLLLVYRLALKHCPDKMYEERYYMLNNRVISYSLDQVFKTYLFNVIYCSVEVKDYLVRVLGGILGLKANMTLTMTSLAIDLYMLKLQLEANSKITCYIQLGGDDFVVILTGPEDIVCEAERKLYAHITEYHGHLGDYEANSINSIGRCHHSLPFCQKTVRIDMQESKQDYVLKVKTLDKLPLMVDQLLSGRSYNDAMAREYTIGITDCLKKFSGRNRQFAITFLYYVFLEVHGCPPPSDVIQERIDCNLFDYVNIGSGILTTSELLRKLERIDPVSEGNIILRGCPFDKLQYLLRLNNSPVKTVKVMLNRNMKTIYCLAEQMRMISGRKYCIEIGEYDENISRLMQKFREVRAYVDGKREELKAALDRPVLLTGINVINN